MTYVTRSVYVIRCLTNTAITRTVYMNTKTASVRLDCNLFDKIDEHCVSISGSRNDFIKSTIEAALDDDVAVPQIKITHIDGVPVKSKIVGIEY